MSLIVLTVGCGRMSSPPPITSRPEAVAKLQKIAQEEYKIPTIVKDLDQTVWVYVPLEENILDVKAKSDDAQAPSPQAEKKMAINLLKVAYEDKSFNIAYDIAPVKQYGGKDPGYEMAYPESFQRKQQNLVGAIGRSFLEMETIPGDVEYIDGRKQATHEKLVKAYVKTDTPPKFFVIVFADIIRGIKMVNTVHYRDLKNSMTSSAMLPEEYMRRYLSEVKGDAKLIGDKTGEHVEYRDIVMPEFLARQIEHRINLKYQHSSLPPGEDTVKEILKIVTDTIQAYQFKDFTLIKLHDMTTGKTLAFDPSQLTTFQQ